MSGLANKGRRREGGGKDRKRTVRTAAVPPVGFLGPMLLLSTLYIRGDDDGALWKRRGEEGGGREGGRER